MVEVVPPGSSVPWCCWVPAMVSFTDPDGNGLVYLADTDESGPR